MAQRYTKVWHLLVREAVEYLLRGELPPSGMAWPSGHQVDHSELLTFFKEEFESSPHNAQGLALTGVGLEYVSPEETDQPALLLVVYSEWLPPEVEILPPEATLYGLRLSPSAPFIAVVRKASPPQVKLAREEAAARRELGQLQLTGRALAAGMLRRLEARARAAIAACDQPLVRLQAEQLLLIASTRDQLGIYLAILHHLKQWDPGRAARDPG